MAVISRFIFKICILSENQHFRNTLASKLRVENFSVSFATGGFHLINLVEKNREDFNMIICHEDMLDMPAFEIITLLRELKSNTELPIIVVSKNESEDEICEMIATGANQYIIQNINYKPIIESAKNNLQLLLKKAA
jgi:DNA-binding response OmpR family regulator